MSILLDLDPVCRISPSEQLALEALILHDSPSELAFRSWIDCVDFDNIRSAVTELVPALFARHAHENKELPHFPRMKGIFCLNFVRNTLLLDAAWQVVSLLQAQGIVPMIFKGASLALGYYETVPLRPMGDIDILVAAHQYRQANSILQENGWRYRYSDEIRRQAEHSCDYINAGGQAIDLHVRALLETRHLDYETTLFERARCLGWRNASVLIPSPEDEAIVCLVNAMRELGPVRLLWLQDLTRIIERSPKFSWGYVWEQAKACGLATTVFHAMQIAGNVRGLERLHSILTELIASSPDFERAYLRDAVRCGVTFGIPKTRRASVQRDLDSIENITREGTNSDRWDESTEAGGAFGVIRVFETEQGKIKGLYLQFRFLPLVPNLFHITDVQAWDEVCYGTFADGEGILEFRPGLLERNSGALPGEAYQVDISLDSPLPVRMAPSEQVIISARVTNTSTQPWPVVGKSCNVFGLSWHAYRPDGSLAAWDHQREYFPPTLLRREKNIAFVKPGVPIRCQIAFTAPVEPGEYRIHFDVVHELVRWFSQTNDKLPVWSLTVSARD